MGYFLIQVELGIGHQYEQVVEVTTLIKIGYETKFKFLKIYPWKSKPLKMMQKFYFPKSNLNCLPFFSILQFKNVFIKLKNNLLPIKLPK